MLPNPSDPHARAEAERKANEDRKAADKKRHEHEERQRTLETKKRELEAHKKELTIKEAERRRFAEELARARRARELEDREFDISMSRMMHDKDSAGQQFRHEVEEKKQEEERTEREIKRIEFDLAEKKKHGETLKQEIKKLEDDAGHSKEGLVKTGAERIDKKRAADEARRQLDGKDVEVKDMDIKIHALSLEEKREEQEVKNLEREA